MNTIYNNTSKMNQTQNLNNTSFFISSDVHTPIADRDRCILPTKFITGRRAQLNRSGFSVNGGQGGNQSFLHSVNEEPESLHLIDPFLDSQLEKSSERMEAHTEDFSTIGPNQSEPTHNPGFISGSNSCFEQIDVQNQTLLPLLNAIKSLKANVSLAANYLLSANNKNLDRSILDANECEKFPSENIVRDIQWHPHCRRISTLNEPSDLRPVGKPRVAIVFNNNTVEIQHTGDHIMLGYSGHTKIYSSTELHGAAAKQPAGSAASGSRPISATESPPAITLRHKLHEDLTCCAWRPFYFSSLAVLSAKNGVLLWQRIGRQDVKSVATISSVNVRGKSEKVVPSSNACLIWQPPSWFKRPTGQQTTANLANLEHQTGLDFSPNGENLLVLWFGTVFLIKISEFSELHGGFVSSPIAKIENLSSPVSYNFSKNTGLFSASTNTGRIIICDSNKPFSIFSNWNESLVLSRYEFGGKQTVQNGCWWEQSADVKRVSTVEGGYLFHYRGSTKMFVIKIFKAPINDIKDKEFTDDCKMIYDLSDIISADTGYLAGVDNDDTLVQARQNFIITALAWRDDVCLVGHGFGHVTIIKSRVNAGGMAFQYIRTLDVFTDIGDSFIIDINIFEDRWCAITSESGEFSYCRIQDF